MPEDVDVAVIGAGPAGSAAAFTLASAGVRTLIVEAKRFPRTKVCGEYISPSATPDLVATAGPELLGSTGARAVDRLTVAMGDRRWTWRTPPGSPAWVLSRSCLDTALLDRARTAGAEVRTPMSVRSVDYHDDSVELSLHGSGGQSERIRAKVVVHADGTGRLDPAGPTPTDRRLVGLKCHVRAPIEGLVMRPGCGAYVGLVGIEDEGIATCALVARSELMRAHSGDRDALLASLWPEYEPAWRESDWFACPVPRSRWRASGHVRSIRVGNAGAALDPAGGEGIGNALWSGRLAGHKLGEWLDSGCELAALREVHRQLKRAYARRLFARMPACRALAASLMRPALAGALARVGSLPVARSLTIEPWLAMTGKSGKTGRTGKSGRAGHPGKAIRV